MIKKVYPLVFTCVLFFYITGSLISLEWCTTRNEDLTTADKLNNSKNEVVKLLVNDFDAEQFDCAAKDILSKSIVIDTTVFGITNKDGNVYLSGKVNCNCVEKYFVKLKCSKEIMMQFNKTKTNNLILAASIKRIDNEKLFANADSLDGTDTILNLGETIILSGECLAIREVI